MSFSILFPVLYCSLYVVYTMYSKVITDFLDRIVDFLNINCDYSAVCLLVNCGTTFVKKSGSKARLPFHVLFHSQIILYV